MRIVVLCGGCSSEREVSIRSAAAVVDALDALSFPHVRIQLDDETLPEGLDPATDIIFPVLHGGFGEDGRLQAELETAGFCHVGCDSASSRLCMSKPATKGYASSAGVPVAPHFDWEPGSALTADEVIARIGEEVVAKPAAEGSSVGINMLSGREEVATWLRQERQGSWLIEKRLRGRELTVGILGRSALGVVEIIPSGGVYDYASKYTKGASDYRFPALLDEETTSRVRGYAESAYKACGCRDFARADFILLPEGEAYFLELNTIPGMTETSLLPKSASCAGLSFTELVKKMVEPALRRANQALAQAG